MLTCLMFLLVSTASIAEIISIPDDCPDLQCAFDLAASGDTVLVSVGSIEADDVYLKRSICLVSESGTSLHAGSSNDHWMRSDSMVAGSSLEVIGFDIDVGSGYLVRSFPANVPFGTVRFANCNASVFQGGNLVYGSNYGLVELVRCSFLGLGHPFGHRIDSVLVDDCVFSHARIEFGSDNGLTVVRNTIISGGDLTLSGNVLFDRVTAVDGNTLRVQYFNNVINSSIIDRGGNYNIEMLGWESYYQAEIGIYYSCIPGGIGNIYIYNGNEQYNSIEIGQCTADNPSLDLDFVPIWGSPCIDTGDPDSPLDPDGTIADMGAFYFCQGIEISLPEEHRLTAEPGYPEEFAIALTSACDPVQVDSARTMTADFSLVESPDLVDGEFKTGEFLLSFSPQAQGLCIDTLHIWANTEISNTEDPRHHVVPLSGEAGPIPASVQDLTIQILEDFSAQLTWSPVDTTIYGNPVTPDWYLVFYNEQDPLDDSDWYYLGPTATPSYQHQLVAQFADVMNYRVVAWKGIDPTVAGFREGSCYSLLKHQ